MIDFSTEQYSKRVTLKMTKLSPLTVTLVLTLLTLGVCDEYEFGHFTNEFVVEIDGGNEVAERVAKNHGFHTVSRVCRIQSVDGS